LDYLPRPKNHPIDLLLPGIRLVHRIVSGKHGDGFVACKLHDHRPVNPCLSGVAYKSAPQVMTPEVLNPCPFKAPSQTTLDASHRVSPVLVSLGVRVKQPSQYQPHAEEAFQQGFFITISSRIARL